MPTRFPGGRLGIGGSGTAEGRLDDELSALNERFGAGAFPKSPTRLDRLACLADHDVAYWGDIDTHGFVILDRLRQNFPHTESVLMDGSRRSHPPSACSTTFAPPNPTCTRDLVEDTFGIAVRLEQERIRYSAIVAALGLTA